mmetsp:Transcript_60778/g.142199  ORF Transcript_60778/g.142199 Transcript_60778/m.142199 type:complete len:200 (+) Transcript_60778:238-837(+)
MTPSWRSTNCPGSCLVSVCSACLISVASRPVDMGASVVVCLATALTASANSPRTNESMLLMLLSAPRTALVNSQAIFWASASAAQPTQTSFETSRAAGYAVSMARLFTQSSTRIFATSRSAASRAVIPAGSALQANAAKAATASACTARTASRLDGLWAASMSTKGWILELRSSPSLSSLCKAGSPSVRSPLSSSATPD